MAIISLKIIWNNHRPFEITIDDSCSILELKRKIAQHFNETYDQFNIMNGKELINNSKNNCTIKSCELKRIVRLCKDYNPGK